MKMESPLEVLSRAASIVQSESKGITPSPLAHPAGNSDSGIEDDLATDYSDRSPKRSASTSPKIGSLKRETSPERLFNAVKCLQKSQKRNEHLRLSPKYIESQHLCSSRKDAKSPNHCWSPKPESEHPYLPPNHTEIQHPRVSLKHNEHSLPKHESHSSPKHLSDERKLSPKQWLTPKPEVNECGRSPKRILDSDKKELKKIKLEEADPRTSSYEIPTEKCCRKSVAAKHDIMSVPHLIAQPGVPITSMMERHVQVLPSYTHSYPPYPPLFILTDKPTNYSKLMATYDSIFSRPPLIPPTLPPPFVACNCGDKNCKMVSPPPVYTPLCRESSPKREKKSERKVSEYAMPNVDEHFRKSLGAKYDIIKCKDVNEKPSSVDDHFAKALGQKWFSMEYGKS